MLEFESTG